MNIRTLSSITLALLLAACGGGSASTSNTATPGGVSNPDTTGSNLQCVNKFTNSWNSVKYWGSEVSEGSQPQVDQVATGGGRYVVAGWGAGYSSSDAVTWKVIPALNKKQIRGLTYGKGVFVAIAEFGGNNVAYVSSDGVDWKSYLVNGKNGLAKELPFFRTTDMAYGNNKFVISGGAGTIMNSADGFNWKKADTVPPNLAASASLSWISFANGVFYMGVGGNTNFRQMLTSKDGENWNLITINGDSIFPSGNISGMQYINGLYVAVDTEGVIANSRDGINWRSVTKNQEALGWGNSIAMGASQLMIVDTATVKEGETRVYTSCDGIRWNSAVTRIGNFGHRMAISDSVAIIINARNIYTSRF